MPFRKRLELHNDAGTVVKRKLDMFMFIFITIMVIWLR